MSDLKFSIYSGDKPIVEWKLGDEPLTLKVHDADQTILEMELRDPRSVCSRGKESKFFSEADDDFTMPMPVGTESHDLQSLMDKLTASDRMRTTPSPVDQMHKADETLAPPELLQSLDVAPIDFNDTDVSQVREGTYSLRGDDPARPYHNQADTLPALEFWTHSNATWSKLGEVFSGEKLSIFTLRVWYQCTGELLISGDDSVQIIGIHPNGDEERFHCTDGFCVTPVGLPVVFQGAHKSFCLRPLKEQ